MINKKKKLLSIALRKMRDVEYYLKQIPETSLSEKEFEIIADILLDSQTCGFMLENLYSKECNKLYKKIEKIDQEINNIKAISERTKNLFKE